ncbi:MAG: 5-formyltetrahydrofolate cyclo-ligase [Flavobacteriaceae bacterium]|jgi:5-formyltetrahydrofolate cyclo-ligase
MKNKEKVLMNKEELRKKYKQKREELSLETIEELSLQIANQSLKLPIWESSNYHLFLSISEKKEINTEYLLHILQGRDKSVIVPKSDFSSGELKHILLQDSTRLQPSSYGIPEPVSGIEIQVSIIDVVFVPLLVFDIEGNRVGYGKGFYDRFLAQCSANTIFIGLSFFEAEPLMENSSLDIPLHYCITPFKTYSFIKT